MTEKVPEMPLWPQKSLRASLGAGKKGYMQFARLVGSATKKAVRGRPLLALTVAELWYEDLAKEGHCIK